MSKRKAHTWKALFTFDRLEQMHVILQKNSRMFVVCGQTGSHFEHAATYTFDSVVDCIYEAVKLGFISDLREPWHYDECPGLEDLVHKLRVRMHAELRENNYMALNY